MQNETVLSRVPKNTSFLQATKFTFSFVTMPFLTYFCQTVQIPGVSTTAPTVPSPFANMYRHGDKLVYDQLSITAIIDEDLQSWKETYDWLVALTKPETYDQYKRFFNPNKRLYHDAVMTINTNANIPNIRVKFYECHPTSISAVQFNTSDNADTILTADIIFRYDYYTIDRLTST